mgnify:CR=1 FL=1
MSKDEKSRPTFQLFGKWSLEGIEVKDPGLKRYISLKPAVATNSGGRHEHQRFTKSSVNIVERLANNMMRHGRCGGKKAKATGIVRNALDIIHLKTGRNPVEVVVEAVTKAAPCEDVTRVAYGGVVYPVSVDLAPQRRIDLALRHLTMGARQSAFSNPRTVDEALADEVISAASRSDRSFAIKKRDEMERVALASR